MIQAVKTPVTKYFSQNKEKGEANSVVKSAEAVTDVLQISNTAKAFAKVDKALNLTNPGPLDLKDLSDNERKEFLKMLSSVLKSGITGYETLEVNGVAEKHFAETEIADKRLNGAKPHKRLDEKH